MKKNLNVKKLLIILLIIALIIIGAVFIVNKVINKEPETPEIPEKQPIFQLPNTTYSEMEVTNIVMEYLEDNNQTVIRFNINNTTDSKVQNQKFTAVLIGPNEEVLAEMPNTYIQDLAVGQQHAVEVIYGGDLTSTKQIKLIKE